MLRARDTMDRTYADDLDIAALARVAHVCAAHFIRTFRERSARLRTATCSAGGSSGRCTCCGRWTPVAKGVDLIEEPTERPYGIDFGLRDPFGNALRISQPPESAK